MASVRPVVPVGPPVGASSVREGVVVALKMARPDDPLSVEALGREVEVFDALCRAPGEPPCPRLYDVVGSPAAGLLMEWCPSDLERWWADRCSDPAAFGGLCSALAEVCRRVREYAAVAEMELGRRVIHADIKPRNVLLNEPGRWLLTDFGASKSRSVDDPNWAATKMILGTENFIAPEALFNARKTHPAAADTWSLGCTFFALLRMRVLLRGGGKMPPNGTHAHHFRTHRAALVADVHLRKPNAFADRELDAAAFPSPDRLPDRDREAVMEAVAGTLGNEHLEARLGNDAINLLDRALQIDPARRYTDALEMAGDFEALATRWKELAVRVDGGPTGPRDSAPAVSAPAP
ncbi:MAG: protein kinase, partial [Deltaproteobacteria bacterium]|nr:protein kinase [Deltaproteobacteria bacterium]